MKNLRKYFPDFILRFYIIILQFDFLILHLSSYYDRGTKKNKKSIVS